MSRNLIFILVLFLLAIFSGILFYFYYESTNLMVPQDTFESSDNFVNVLDPEFNYLEQELPFQVFEFVVNSDYAFDPKFFILPRVRFYDISDETIQIKYSNEIFSIPLGRKDKNLILSCVEIPSNISPEKIYIDLLRSEVSAGNTVSLLNADLFTEIFNFLQKDEIIYISFKSDAIDLGIHSIYYFREKCEK